MRRLLPFLSCLMLVLSLWTGARAHAAETLTCGEVTELSASVHFEGDGDEVPADADMGVPHHHGSCHGHHVGLPDATQASRIVPVALALVGLSTTDGRGPAELDRTLRPPIA